MSKEIDINENPDGELSSEAKEKDSAAGNTSESATDGLTSVNAAEKSIAEGNVEQMNEEQIKPRKRKIVRNRPLAVAFPIVLLLFFVLLSWVIFFDNSFSGTWHYMNTFELEETQDIAYISSDTAETIDQVETTVNEYTTKIAFNFGSNDAFSITTGTLTLPGFYMTANDDDGTPVLVLYVYYDGTPSYYDSYYYEFKGNLLTGKKIVLTNDEGESFELVPGEGEIMLNKFDNMQLDDNLVGTWNNSERGMTYEFNNDGTMHFEAEDGLAVDFVYTVMKDANTILVKYYGNSELSDSYMYSIDDNGLYLNGVMFSKVN